MREMNCVVPGALVTDDDHWEELTRWASSQAVGATSTARPGSAASWHCIENALPVVERRLEEFLTCTSIFDGVVDPAAVEVFDAFLNHPRLPYGHRIDEILERFSAAGSSWADCFLACRPGLTLSQQNRLAEMPDAAVLARLADNPKLDVGAVARMIGNPCVMPDTAAVLLRRFWQALSTCGLVTLMELKHALFVYPTTDAELMAMPLQLLCREAGYLACRFEGDPDAERFCRTMVRRSSFSLRQLERTLTNENALLRRAVREELRRRVGRKAVRELAGRLLVAVPPNGEQVVTEELREFALELLARAA